jgi:hypothetical protein
VHLTGYPARPSAHALQRIADISYEEYTRMQRILVSCSNGEIRLGTGKVLPVRITSAPSCTLRAPYMIYIPLALAPMLCIVLRTYHTKNIKLPSAPYMYFVCTLQDVPLALAPMLCNVLRTYHTKNIHARSTLLSCSNVEIYALVKFCLSWLQVHLTYNVCTLQDIPLALAPMLCNVLRTYRKKNIHARSTLVSCSNVEIRLGEVLPVRVIYISAPYI